MLTKLQVKDIRSLAQHKNRKELQSYVVEGDKMAREWLASGVEIKQIIALDEWLQQHEALVRRHKNAVVNAVKEHELEKISLLDTPNKVLLVVALPGGQLPLPDNEWCIALDKLQDPGNMGTIIRIADWFGIDHIIASPDSVDFYNSKVLQSSMGGHLRVKLHTLPLERFLQQTKLPILAATLDGRNIYQSNKPEAAVLLIGNESKGVSPEIQAFATHKVMIPRRGGAESLNAAVATGIICALMIE